MWRSNSYEGTTKAFLTTSASMARDISASSSGSTRSYIGTAGLAELEKQEGRAPAISQRLKLIRQLVTLRGEKVLDGVDIEKVVWLEGTNLHMTTEEELAVRLPLCCIEDS